MKQPLISLIGLIVVIAVAATVMGFALGSGSGSPAQDPTGEITHGDPTYDEWLSDFGDGIGDGKVLTSADDIDPNVCNLIHNINACSPEELEAGRALTDEAGEDIEVEPGSEYGDTEPLFVDGGPGYIVQPLDEAVREDCSLAGGTIYVTFEGELGCVVVQDLEDNGDELVTSSQPPTIEPLPVPAPR